MTSSTHKSRHQEKQFAFPAKSISHTCGHLADVKCSRAGTQGRYLPKIEMQEQADAEKCMVKKESQKQ